MIKFAKDGRPWGKRMTSLCMGFEGKRLDIEIMFYFDILVCRYASIVYVFKVRTISSSLYVKMESSFV